MPDEATGEDVHDVHRIESAVEIEAARAEVFDLWLQLEDLPQILDGVERVKRLGGERVLWDVDVAGHQLLWEAEITRVEPGERIAWRSRWGTPNAGEMRFRPIGDDRTRLEVEIEFRPSGLLERLGAFLGLARRQVEADLSCFRRFVEAAQSPQASS